MEQTSTWVKIGGIADFPQGKKTPITVNQLDILIYHNNDSWYAFERHCPHQKGKLDASTIDGTVLTCPHHHLRFSIATGEIVQDGGYLSLSNLKVFPLKVEDDTVYIHPRQWTLDSWDRGLEM